MSEQYVIGWGNEEFGITAITEDEAAANAFVDTYGQEVVVVTGQHYFEAFQQGRIGYHIEMYRDGSVYRTWTNYEVISQEPKRLFDHPLWPRMTLVAEVVASSLDNAIAIVNGWRLNLIERGHWREDDPSRTGWAGLPVQLNREQYE